MSDKPEKWLQAVAEDAQSHASLGFVERFRRALRFFRTGRSKVSQKVLRDFLAWQENQQEKEPIAAAIDDAPADSDPAPAPLAADDSLGSIRLIIVDLRGGGTLQGTLDSLPLDAFHSHTIVSPISGERLFELFPTLDAAIREDTDASSVLLLESGAVLTTTPAPLPENCDASFLRWQSDDGTLTSSPLDKQSLLREPLAPMAFPAIHLRAGVTLDFAECWHYAGWDLLLRLIEATPERLHFPDAIGVNFSHHSYALSKLDRAHLKHSAPEKLPSLPDANDEWTVTRHDLITRIVQRHPDYFRDNAAYLAAIAAATRGC